MDLNVLSLLRDLYFAIFTLFFRLSGWGGEARYRTAAMCVTALEGVMIINAWAFFQVVTGTRIDVSKWIVAAIIVIIFLLNENYLLGSERAINIEKRFSAFSSTKQNFLILIASLVVLGCFLILILAVSKYHGTFQIGGRP